MRLREFKACENLRQRFLETLHSGRESVFKSRYELFAKFHALAVILGVKGSRYKLFHLVLYVFRQLRQNIAHLMDLAELIERIREAFLCGFS